MVRVMTMPVLVLHRFVDVLVLLRQVQSQAETHQASGDHELHP